MTKQMISYDEEADALVLTIHSEYKFQNVIELSDNLLLEIDVNGI
ncbi:DUF2283 domain-containing protein [Methanosphaera sp. WGK6]|nr:DUF2283 domain-containing protein [Methanosphaera sp. WGK6]